MMRILVIASGGGHTGYGVALAEELRKCGEIDAVIPCGDEWSRRLLEKLVNNIYCVSKLRHPLEPAWKYIVRLPKALYESLKIKKYDVVIATGNNHSLLPSLFQKMRGSRLYVVESHDRLVTKSKTARILARLGATPLLHWERQKELYSNGLVLGPIVRRPRYKPRNNGYVLVVGGYEGDKELFDEIYKAHKSHPNLISRLIMQTGRIDPSIYRGENVIAFRFSEDIDYWISGADVVIGHTGTTLLEAQVNYRKPVIIYASSKYTAAAKMEDIDEYASLTNAMVANSPREAVEHIITKSYKEPALMKRMYGIDLLRDEICG